MSSAGVYFMSNQDGLIKIGASWNVKQRLTCLRSVYRWPLELVYVLASNDHAFYLEAQIQTTFRYLKVPDLDQWGRTGRVGWTEWFLDDPDIQNFIRMKPEEWWFL